MKVLPIPLLACLLAAPQALAQQPAPTPAAGQSRAAQSPELEEASRLSRTFVKLFSAGKYAEAQPLAERALAIREKLLEPSAVPVADALMNLGAVMAATNKADRARAAYERAATIYEAGLGPDHDRTTDVLNTLGWLYYRRKDYRKAEAAFRRAAEARERAHGAAHELVADSLSGLAVVHLAGTDEKKRDDAYWRLLDAAEKLPEVPTRLERILTSYTCSGARREDATPRQLEVLNRIERLWKQMAQAEAAKSRRVVGSVLNGRAILKPAPAYPEEAKQARAEGMVIVHITVDETGRVIDAAAICGPPLLFEASVRAARQARFTPTLVDGQPTKVTGTITYNYNLTY